MNNKITRFLTIICAAASATAYSAETSGARLAPVPSKPSVDRAAENVVLITSDGLRWQEIFRGMNRDMLTAKNKVTTPSELLAKYDADTTEARRAKLMPFLWGTAAKKGQFYGDHDANNEVHVTNNMWFSYPGYSELITGHADDKHIKSNRKIPNPNTNVFEWLAQGPQYKDEIFACGAWTAFPYIFNSTRGHINVKGTGKDPYKTFISYVKKHKPHVMFLGFGPTDHWAHKGDYVKYLDAAHDVDAHLAQLWKTFQSIPQYKGKTTFIFTADHGRGNSKTSPKSWNSHGRKVPGSNSIFLAIWGPDTPDEGVVHGGPLHTQSQVAATVAAALGYDYHAATPKAGKAIESALNAKTTDTEESKSVASGK